MKNLQKVLPTPLLGMGLALLFVAIKVAGEGTAATVMTGLGLLFCLGTLGLRANAFVGAKEPAKAVEGRILAATAGVLLSLGLYWLSTEGGLGLIGFTGEEAERPGTILAVLWPAVLVVSASALFFMELAYFRMPIPEAVEKRRISAAAHAGLSVALALVFVASLNYVATARDQKTDLSYLRTTRPSDTTLRMARALEEPVRVYLLYPEVNEVLDQLMPYFRELDQASERLDVRVRDHALVPELVRRHRVRDNGYILIVRGEGDSQQAENFLVGTELAAARSRLRSLDGRFQEKLAHLTQRPRELHLTAGHRERSSSGADGDAAGQRTGELSTALRRSNIEARSLGLAQGLANDVPEDTRAIAVIGPRSPFLPEEAQSLLRYVQRGGRLLVMVDPNTDHGLDPLLHGLGVELLPGVLHSEQYFVRRSQTLADRANIHGNEYSSHPTVTLTNRYARSGRIATIFLEGAAIGRYQGEGVIEGATPAFPIRTGAGYFRDLDGDHQRAESEPLESRLNMMAAITVAAQEGGEEGRAVILPDGDFATDQVISNPGNAFVIMDALQWLVGAEEIVGPVTSEEDVRIEHTNEEDKLWFWGTTFGVPLPFLILGIWVAVRRRRFVDKPTQKGMSVGLRLLLAVLLSVTATVLYALIRLFLSS